MILQRLSHEHRNIRKLLDILERELEVFDAGERPDYELIRSIISYFEVYTEIYHHPQEDAVYARLKLRNPAAARRIGNLALEHRQGANRLRRMAETIDLVLSNGTDLRENVDTVVREFIAHERRHMTMEDKEFFPAARETLEPEDWEAVASALDHNKDPLFSNEAEGRFGYVREYILGLEQEAETERSRRNPRSN